MANFFPLVLSGIVIEELQSGDLVDPRAFTEVAAAMPASAIDLTNGGIQTKTISANTTFTDSLTAGQSVVLMLEGGSSYTVTWPTTTWVSNIGNSAPTLTAKSVVVFWKIGTTLYGEFSGSYV